MFGLGRPGRGRQIMPHMDDLNTPQMAAAEVRIIQGRCEVLYTSPYAEERRQASSALCLLQNLRKQKTKARVRKVEVPPPPPTPGSNSTIAKQLLEQRASYPRSADVDLDDVQDLKLSFEEFYALFPRSVRETRGSLGILEWFNAADTDGSGSLSMNEFFAWTLSSSTDKHGVGTLRRIFERFDREKCGSLNTWEFESLCESVKYGRFASEVFASLDNERTGKIDYAILDRDVLRRSEDGSLSARTKGMLSSLMVAEMHAEITTQTSANADEVRQLAAKWSLKERESALKLFAELQALLASSGVLVIDIMGLVNNDLEPLIDESEFHSTLQKVFKCRARPWVIDECFGLLDHDGSGVIGMDELFEFVRGYRHAHDKRSLNVRRCKIRPPHGVAWCLADLAWDVENLRIMLYQMLDRAGAPVCDLVKAWDRSGDRVLSEEEFLHNLESLFPASLGNLFRRDVRPVGLEAFKLIAGAERPDGMISSDELEMWLEDRPDGRIRLKPVNELSDGAKHCGVSLARAVSHEGLLQPDTSSASPGFKRILERSTRSMLLRRTQAHSLEEERQQAMAKAEQLRKNTLNYSSSSIRHRMQSSASLASQPPSSSRPASAKPSSERAAINHLVYSLEWSQKRPPRPQSAPANSVAANRPRLTSTSPPPTDKGLESPFLSRPASAASFVPAPKQHQPRRASLALAHRLPPRLTSASPLHTDTVLGSPIAILSRPASAASFVTAPRQHKHPRSLLAGIVGPSRAAGGKRTRAVTPPRLEKCFGSFCTRQPSDLQLTPSYETLSASERLPKAGSLQVLSSGLYFGSIP